MNRENLVALMKAVSNANPSAPTSYSFNGESFTYSALNETLRKELNALGGSWDSYRQNKNLIFSIIEEVLTEVVPERTRVNYEQFAEVKRFGQGEKPLFRRKVQGARTRAKQFITRVGLAGRYEVFKLGGEESFEVPTAAFGGAAQIGIEELMDGRANWAELVDIVMEGLDDAIYQEIGKALMGAINQLPATNRVVATDFDEVAFDRLLGVASAYGQPTIYCSYDFAVKMIPQRQWMYSDNMKEELWKNGHFTNYKGYQVIILPNGFIDETNTTRQIDPGYCWIIGAGGDNKPVKVAFEGGLMVKEHDNDDWSHDIHVYEKVGVVAMMTNNICSYVDSTLAGKLDISDMVAAQYKYFIENENPYASSEDEPGDDTNP